jgi:uncharacterized membrane protein YphA (DoxX/SURF4 family)
MSNQILTKQAKIISWIAQVIAAGILAVQSFFKLTSSPESIALFEILAVEPWGRYLVGLGELLATILLLTPRTAGYGGLLAMVIMMGAIATHLLLIGINYGGGIFYQAVVVLLAALAIVTIRRPKVLGLGAARRPAG